MQEGEVLGPKPRTTAPPWEPVKSSNTTNLVQRLHTHHPIMQIFWMFKKSFNCSSLLRCTGHYRIRIIKAHYAMIAECKKRNKQAEGNITHTPLHRRSRDAAASRRHQNGIAFLSQRQTTLQQLGLSLNIVLRFIYTHADAEIYVQKKNKNRNLRVPSVRKCICNSHDF